MEQTSASPLPFGGVLTCLLWMVEPSLLGSQDGGRFNCFALESECTRRSNCLCVVTWHSATPVEAVAVAGLECERDARKYSGCLEIPVATHFFRHEATTAAVRGRATTHRASRTCVVDWVLCGDWLAVWPSSQEVCNFVD